MVIDKAGQRRAVPGKALDKCGRRHIQIVGTAIMKHVPDDLHAMLVRCIEHRQQGRKIIGPGAFDLRPDGPIPDGADIETVQQLVVGQDLAVVLGDRQHIQAGARFIDMAGRLEAGQEERIKKGQDTLHKACRQGLLIKTGRCWFCDVSIKK